MFWGTNNRPVFFVFSPMAAGGRHLFLHNQAPFIISLSVADPIRVISEIDFSSVLQDN